MSLRRRVGHLERTLEKNPDLVLPVILDGVHDEAWRPRVEEARRNGNTIRVIRIGLQAEAATREEAEAIIARHREEHDRMDVEVYLRGSEGRVVLAAWDPGLPAWLRDPGDGVMGEQTIASL